MAIDRKGIRHLEQLARLELSAEEVGPITEQVNRIVEFVKKLQSADTSNIEATKLMSEEDSLRDDEVVEGLPRDEVLEQAPDATGEFFRVPRVIDRGDSA